MAAPIIPPFFATATGPVVTDSELERAMARATMTLGAGLLSAGLIWSLSNSGGPRTLLLCGGVLSAFGWAWYTRTGVLAPPEDGSGQIYEGELL